MQLSIVISVAQSRDWLGLENLWPTSFENIQANPPVPDFHIRQLKLFKMLSFINDPTLKPTAKLPYKTLILSFHRAGCPGVV